MDLSFTCPKDLRPMKSSTALKNSLKKVKIVKLRSRFRTILSLFPGLTRLWWQWGAIPFQALDFLWAGL